MSINRILNSFRQIFIEGLFVKIYSLLSKEQRKSGFWVLVALLLNSLLDLLGISAFIPIIFLLIEEDPLKKHPFLAQFQHLLNIQTENGVIAIVLLLVMVVIVLKNILSVFLLKFQSKFSYSIYQSFAQKTFLDIYNRGFDYINKLNSHILLHKTSSVPIYFAVNILIPAFILLNELVILITVLVFLAVFVIHLKLLFLLFVVIVPVIFFLYNYSKKKAVYFELKRKEIEIDLSSTLQQSFHGFIDIVTSNKERYFYNNFKKQIKELSDISVYNVVLKSLPAKLIESSLIGGIVIIIMYGLYNHESKGQILTILAGIALASYRIIPSINKIMVSLITIKGFNYVFEELEPLKNINDSVMPDENAITKLKYSNNLKMTNVSFSYTEENKILNSINLNIQKGECIGIIGKSGSGKTTLVNILLRFLIENEGDVLVDDMKLNDLNQVGWRLKIGYVPQNVYIIDGNIRENIAFGVSSDKIDVDLLNKVVKLAQLDDLINSLPEKFDSRVGERGGFISGGQKQRIGIARALYKGAEVLIFDEATSSLDDKTEKEVTDAINNLSLNRNLTIILVAHRKTTLKYCNRIIEYSYENLKNINDAEFK
jgi:ABC-type multidrug transport system fused ATPase/permease subunit